MENKWRMENIQSRTSFVPWDLKGALLGNTAEDIPHLQPFPTISNKGHWFLYSLELKTGKTIGEQWLDLPRAFLSSTTDVNNPILNCGDRGMGKGV